MSKKQKNTIEKLLEGPQRELMAIEILIGDGGITGGFKFDNKLDKKMRECLGEKYVEIFDDFRKIGQKPCKEIGRRLSKLIIEDALGEKMSDDVEGKEELIELIAKLGEVLSKVTNVECMEVEEDEEEDDDEENELEDDEDDDE